jgi:D-arabinose 1-dehydrogenase-like Zn-dependent alcohol dehydrogenase
VRQRSQHAISLVVAIFAISWEIASIIYAPVFREFLEAGKITPVIDRTYPLSEASEAIRYLMEAEPLGRTIIVP